MVVSAGRGPAGAEPAERGRRRSGARRFGRREVTRLLVAGAGALAVAPVVAASRPDRRPAEVPYGNQEFDETYRGRRIRGVETGPARAVTAAGAPGPAGAAQTSGAAHASGAATVAAGAGAAGAVAAGAAQWHVTVDGHTLHLMRRADGTWLSMIDHYGSYATPLEAARAAVDELGGRNPVTAYGGSHGGGHTDGHGGTHPGTASHTAATAAHGDTRTDRPTHAHTHQGTLGYGEGGHHGVRP